MNILVTGGAGYIGSRLVPKLLADGHKVTVLDTMWFGDGDLPKDNGNLTVINGDVRNQGYEEYDSVIWLASVSNNDMYAISTTTHDVNTWLEVLPKGRFIYASSVAVQDPTSDYAKDKLYCEDRLKDTGAIIVRAASVCGYSANMRFDITLNRMTHDAYKTGVITVNGGEQERSHVHIDDLCDFYRQVLLKGTQGNTYTVCAVSQKVADSAINVARSFEDMGKVATVKIQPRSDNRSYHVENWNDFGWIPKRSVFDGCRDIVARFEQGCWKDTMDERLWRINKSL